MTKMDEQVKLLRQGKLSRREFLSTATALGMALRLPVSKVAASGLEGALSAFIAGAMTMVLLPVFERLFKITTNFTLLELLDRNHPLLQRMSIEAPGTFHHSMLVAELAREGVAQIGGNALLACALAVGLLLRVASREAAPSAPRVTGAGLRRLRA